MAKRNQALDDRIRVAAGEEFMEKGFTEASLRSIAEKAGITTGALYTRYAGKDELFAALVVGIEEAIDQAFSELSESYHKTGDYGAEAVFGVMEVEAAAIMSILFAHYEEALLLFCRSAGSSSEDYFDRLVDRKIQETDAFFAHFPMDGSQRLALELLLSTQFEMYRQILKRGCSRAEAESCMESVLSFMTAGWQTILPKLMRGE